MTARDITLTLGSGDNFAAAKSVNVEFSHAPIEYTPIPGSVEDDGWRHYRPGKLSWKVDSDKLYTTDDTILKKHTTGNQQEQTINVIIRENGEEHRISGLALLVESSLRAAVRALSQYTAKFHCIDFPTL